MEFETSIRANKNQYSKHGETRGRARRRAAAVLLDEQCRDQIGALARRERRALVAGTLRPRRRISANGGQPQHVIDLDATEGSADNPVAVE